ncbi:MAG: DMT family transporter [Candidatus Aminicenantes bacterium]|nr:DMT family transporter [Candidatus Aminicenantes bacterium]
MSSPERFDKKWNFEYNKLLMLKEKDQKKAYIYASIAILLWSTVATVFKLTLKYTGYSELLLLSVFFSFIALSLVVSVEKKWRLVLDLTKKDIISAALLGFLNPFLYYFLIFRAYAVLPAQIAQPLNQIWGVVIVLMSIPLLKQKIGIKAIAGVIVSFFGVVILSTGGNFSFVNIKEPLGVIFALLSSVVWSLYWILNTKSKKDPVILLLINFFAGLIFAIIYCSIFLKIGNIPIKAFYGSLYIGFFEMGLTFLFWLKALKYSVTTAKVSILIYLAPFLSLILIHYVLGEKILFSSLTGLIFIISGILISRTDKKAQS